MLELCPVSPGILAMDLDSAIPYYQLRIDVPIYYLVLVVPSFAPT